MRELNVFLWSARETRYQIAFFIAAWTGMRQSEILGMRWKDIDFDNKMLRVVQTLRHNSTELISTTKTKASNRNIALSDQTIEALQKHRRRQIKERLHAGEVYNNHDLVVCTAVGTPLNSRNLNRALYNLIKKAKIK
ncbi:site-specific integrase [Paenibacillus wynnii]|uniref:site-specific integrase n=1 Tax=Paenibacillus wynnii TaxID=268407 RepID=UPI002792BB19|nr:site-specific integrase [Paenibacillus wynnii]MDQ0193077.1 integrase [Paenibacillus wynnii]